jgi:hypothetical protein
LGRDEEDGKVGRPNILAQPLQHLPAVHPWHKDVQQHEVRRIAAYRLQCLFAIGGGINGKRTITGMQYARKEPQHVGVVVDDEHTSHRMADLLNGLLQIGPRHRFC